MTDTSPAQAPAGQTAAARMRKRGGERPMQRLWRQFRQSPVALISLAVLVAIIAAAVLAPLLAPQNPYDLRQIDVLDGTLPPGSQSLTGMTYLLGTDGQGRDMLSAILYGLRISIGVSATATIIALAIGMTLGMMAAYLGGRVDAVIMRLVDLQLSFPSMLIALILLALLGRGVDKVIVALVTVQWAYYARTVRGAALVERGKEYIEAAKCLRLSTPRIVFSHLMPNCLPPLIVVAMVQIAHAISLEATLSFLGVGVPVTQPSLGMLISNGFDFMMSGKYWISFFPGIALVVTVMSINLVGDRLRDLGNPRLNR